MFCKEKYSNNSMNTLYSVPVLKWTTEYPGMCVPGLDVQKTRLAVSKLKDY